MTAPISGSEEVTIAFAGNPNVGKSTLFNLLTGSDQHTGNWAGKTVSVAQGSYTYKGKEYVLIDLPGTYSLTPSSEEERVTAEYLFSNHADCIVVVADATCIERSICFLLQVLLHQTKVVLCVNLMDEAKKQGIQINLSKLRTRLGISVAATSASNGTGVEELKEMVRNASDGFLPASHRLNKVYDKHQLYDEASSICEACVTGLKEPFLHYMDRIVLHRIGGKLVMLLLFFSLLWLTIYGANSVSLALEHILDGILVLIKNCSAPLPNWLSGVLIDGMLGTVFTVISVMLPPMLIFFPLFSVLEDLGYLPRVAFMTDHIFSKCGSCGKQALTMSMGIGCNAVGVMGARIISSPTERMAAILTNSFMPCNGRFPAMITLITIFFSDIPLLAAAILSAFLLLSVCMTLLTTKVLTSFGSEVSSTFILEMPPYRRPRLLLSLKRSVWEKTLFMLSRAILVSAPAGAVIWVLEHISVKGAALTTIFASWLDPIGVLLGMNGAVLLAFILSLPANELVLPLFISIVYAGQLYNTAETAFSQVLYANGWTWQMALCTIIFLLFHWPCSTTILTIYKETKSYKRTAIAVILPTMIGALLCFFLQIILR